METVHTHFAATRKSYRVVKYAEDDINPNIRVLLGIGCTLPVSFAGAELLSFILWLATNQVISQKQDVWWVVVRILHSCTYIMTLKFMLTKSVQSLLPSTRGGYSKGAAFTSRFQVHGKGPRNYNVHRHCWEGVWGCGGKQFGTKTCLWNWQNDRKRYFYFRKQAFLDMDRCERDEIMKACASLVTEI